MSEDLISRQKAIRLITGYNGVMDKSVAKRLLIQMPSVQPEQRWIPCSERTPDTDRYVLCTTENKKGVRTVVRGYYTGDSWAVGMNPNVIAWMEMPEPYQEATS